MRFSQRETGQLVTRDQVQRVFAGLRLALALRRDGEIQGSLDIADVIVARNAVGAETRRPPERTRRILDRGPGRHAQVDKLLDEKVEPEVLLTVVDDKVTVGTPLVKDAKVTVKILDQVKGEKIHVYKFKAKSRYRKHTGFRAKLTKVLVEKLG